MRIGTLLTSYKCSAIFTFPRIALRQWANSVLSQNTTYYRTRRQLFESFTQLLGDRHIDDAVRVDSSLVTVIRLFLMSRSDALSEASRLGFETAVNEILTLCERIDAQVQSGWFEVALGVTHIALRVVEGFVQPGYVRHATIPTPVTGPEVEVGGQTTPFQDNSILARRSSSVSRSLGSLTPQSALAERVEEDVCKVGQTVLDGELCKTVNAPRTNRRVSFHKPTLADAITRPVRIASFANPVSTAFNFPVWSGAMSMTSLAPSLATVYPYTDLFRATMVFRLTWNPPPVCAGRLLLSWQPESLPINNDSSLNSPYQRCRTMGVTHLPSVVADIAANTTVELRVPWFYRMTCMPPYAFLGTCAVNALLPLRLPTGTTITFNLYGFLEDIEACDENAANLVNVTVQSALSNEYPDNQLRDVPATVKDGVVALASLAGVPDWAISTAKGLAKAYGFSTPRDTLPTVSTVKRCHPTHVDAPSPSVAVTPFSRNTLSFTPTLTPSGMDEMALAWMFSRPSWIARGAISTTQAVRTTFYLAALSPHTLYGPCTTTTGLVHNAAMPRRGATPPNANTNFFFTPSTIMSIGSMFASFRGDITFRFTFNPTIYTTARIKATYALNASGVSPAGTSRVLKVSDPSYVDSPSVIHSVSLAQPSFEITVPFTNISEWLSTEKSYGTVSLSLESPFVDSSLGGTLSFMVEVWSNNMRVADYIGPQYPVAPAILDLSNSKFMVPQSGLTSEVMCKGEEFTSAKQIIQIPTPGRLKLNAASGASETILVPQWFTPTTLQSTTDTTHPYSNLPVTSCWGFNPGQYIAQHYAYARGGSVYSSGKIFSGFKYKNPSALAKQPNSGSFHVEESKYYAFPYSGANMFELVGAEYYVSPYTTDPVGTAVNSGVISRLNVWEQRQDISAVEAHIYTDNTSGPVDSTLSLFRSAADDAYCSYWLGPPLMHNMHIDVLDPDPYLASLP